MQPNRQHLTAKIHIAKTQLKMDEETYRHFLQNCVGKNSCKEMHIAELTQVLKALEQKGFRPTTTKFKNQARPTPRADKQKYIKKITALLCNQNKPTSYADRIAKQAFGIDFVHWLEIWQLKKVIQMLEVHQYRKEK